MNGTSKSKIWFLMVLLLLLLPCTVAAQPNSPYATNPDPADGEIIDAILHVLTWQPGAYAASHDIFFSTNFDDVNNGAPAAFKRNQTGTLYLAVGLVRGTTYYWRINEVNNAHPDSPWPGPVWQFTVQGPCATNPNPPDGAQGISLDPLLEWQPGAYAASHDIYFSTNFNDVSNSAPAAFRTNQTGTTYLVVGLTHDTTYYWRINEVNDAHPDSPWLGRVWTFTTRRHILYVDAGATGANDGSSWADAYNYLQDALADANSSPKPVEIRVAKGICTPDSNSAVPDGTGDREATFQLINGVTLRGGYAGFGEPDPDARDIGLYETVLSGDLNGDDGLAPHDGKNDNCFHLVTVPDTCKAAVLDGFTVTGGNAWSSSPMYERGGGIYCMGEATVINCKVSGNDAVCGGGMCSDSNSSPTLIGCAFSENDAHRGGGMYNESAKPTVTKCTFGNNSAYYGGAMLSRESNPTITNCVFTDNSALDGGAIHTSNDGSTTIVHCTFRGNSAESEGGGIWSSSDAEIRNCTISGNRARSSCWSEHRVIDLNHDCGIDWQDLRILVGQWLEHCDCLADPNDCADFDGANGVNMADFARLAANSWGKAAHGGGGIFCEAGQARISNCTITGNASGSCGGGIYWGQESSPTITNCVLWDNSDYTGSGQSAQVYGAEEAILEVNYSCIQGWTGSLGGAGNMDSDPCFAVPGYWADANEPNVPAQANDPNAVWVDGDYHLKSEAGRWDQGGGSWVQDDVTSPCIDAGDPTSSVGDEPGANGGRINMGAYGGTAEASKSLCFYPGLVDCCGHLVTEADVDRWVSLGRPECWCYGCHCRDDANNSCRVNAIDVNRLRAAWPGFGGSYDPCVDTNYDGVINAIDVRSFREWWLSWIGLGCIGCPGCP